MVQPSGGWGEAGLGDESVCGGEETDGMEKEKYVRYMRGMSEEVVRVK